MAKVSVNKGNDFCPQTLFVYGTFKEDGEANFGLFCWFSYCWFDEMGVMACIGGSKMTLDRIRKTRVFSANLVTKNILPLADRFGTVDGYDKGKVLESVKWENGEKLNVPVLTESPLSFELEVDKFIEIEGSTVLLCRVRNTLMDERLADDSRSVIERIKEIAPVSTTCQTYFDWTGESLGMWHEPCKSL